MSRKNLKVSSSNSLGDSRTNSVMNKRRGTNIGNATDEDEEDQFSNHDYMTTSAKGNEMLIDQNGINEPVSVEGAPPADLSDDDDEDEDPAKDAFNKQALLEWLTVADFTGEMSLTTIASHKFKLD